MPPPCPPKAGTPQASRLRTSPRPPPALPLLPSALPSSRKQPSPQQGEPGPRTSWLQIFKRITIKMAQNKAGRRPGAGPNPKVTGDSKKRVSWKAPQPPAGLKRPALSEVPRVSCYGGEAAPPPRPGSRVPLGAEPRPRAREAQAGPLVSSETQSPGPEMAPE